MPAGASVDILATVGDAESQVVSIALGDDLSEVAVTVLLPVGGDAMVSLTFDSERFLAFVEQLRRFAAAMPGRPS